MSEKNLKATLQADMKAAMKAKERERLTVIRSVLAVIQQEEIARQGETLSDEDYSTILNRLVNQRKESIAQFKEAGRDDLVTAEESELAYLEPYLPEPLSEEEVLKIIATAMEEVGASSMKEMGAVMNLVRPQVMGRFDMGKISTLVRSKLS